MSEDAGCGLVVLGCAWVTCLLAFRFTESANSRYDSWWQQFSYWWDSVGIGVFALVLVAYMLIAAALGFLQPVSVEY